MMMSINNNNNDDDDDVDISFDILPSIFYMNMHICAQPSEGLISLNKTCANIGQHENHWQPYNKQEKNFTVFLAFCFINIPEFHHFLE